MGHTVVRLQESQEPTGRMLQEALTSQLFVWVHTHNWDNRGHISMPQLLATLRERGIPTISYHLDLFVGIPSRWKTYSQDLYIRGGLSDFFTVDPPLADWLSNATRTTGHYLPAGVLEAECYLAPPTESFDVCFVGSRRYHPEWPYRPQLIDWLENTYKDRFRLYGQDGGKVVRGAELNQVYANTKVVVGDSFSPGFHYPGFWSDRVYETPGRGGFLIHPRIKGLEEQFVEDQEMVFYDFLDFDQLGRKIDYYLTHDEEREKIRVAGHERVKTGHTYRHRWEHILATLKVGQ